MVDGELKKCKFLVKLKNKSTLCRIYHTRLGTVLYEYPNKLRVTCNLRQDVPYNYTGCPFNKDGQEMVR